MSADEKDEVDLARRKLLKKMACTLGACGIVAVATPFVAALMPSKKAKLANEPLTVDISSLAIGEMQTVHWRGQPVWIIRRSEAELHALKKNNPHLRDPYSITDQQPSFAKNVYRSLQPEILILIGICTHLGCIPNFMPQVSALAPDWTGGFLCPCHGSRYDLSGRVFKNMPAPLNLQVPPYHFIDKHTVVIGV
jgi:ubiquinol-cytochrome c reductase iron-sulfur subunit